MKNKIAAVLAFMITLLNIMCIPRAAAGTEVKTGSTETAPGETIEIPITISGNTGFSNLAIEIDYDSDALTLTAVNAGSGISAAMTAAPSFSQKPYNIQWDSAGNVTFNGTLATLVFKVSNTASGSSDITVDYYKGRDGNNVPGEDVNYDESYNALDISYISGAVTVDNPDATPTPAETAAPTEAPETAPVISISDISAKPGSEITVTIDLKNNTGFANLGVEVGFEADVMTLTDVKGIDVDGISFVNSQSVDVLPQILTWNSIENNSYNGTLAELTFKLNDNAANGDHIITIGYQKGISGNYVDGVNVNYDENFEPIGLKYKNGTVAVERYNPGDINDDGVLDNRDGTILLRKLAGWDVEANPFAIDVDRDGTVDNKDGTILLRKLAGWDIDIH